MDSKTTIYFDSSDPANLGLAYRTRHEGGSEDSGEVDGLAGEAIEALIAGDKPSSEGLDDLRANYGPSVVIDGVGEVFGGWDQ